MTILNTGRIARLTGGAYLGIIVTGIFSGFFVRMGLSRRATPRRLPPTLRARRVCSAPDRCRFADGRVRHQCGRGPVCAVATGA